MTLKRAIVYPVTIDYTQTFWQMIVAGRYDWRNSDISEKHFSVKGEGVVERTLELVHYGKNMTPMAALEAIERKGYRPATIEELLAFGATYPDLPQDFPIIALGAVWEDPDYYRPREIACLDRDKDGRGLGLDSFFDTEWHAGCRFLAVRK